VPDLGALGKQWITGLRPLLSVSDVSARYSILSARSHGRLRHRSPARPPAPPLASSPRVRPSLPRPAGRRRPRPCAPAPSRPPTGVAPGRAASLPRHSGSTAHHRLPAAARLPRRASPGRRPRPCAPAPSRPPTGVAPGRAASLPRHHGSTAHPRPPAAARLPRRAAQRRLQAVPSTPRFVGRVNTASSDPITKC
jgi:hypothetical protein